MSATLPEQLSESTRAFAGRDFGAAADGRTFDTLDPSTGADDRLRPAGRARRGRRRRRRGPRRLRPAPRRGGA